MHPPQAAIRARYPHLEEIWQEPVALYTDSSDMPHGDMKKKPLILVAMGLPRHCVFKDSAFTAIGDIAVLSNIPGLRKSFKSKMQPWVEQVSVEQTIRGLKVLCTT